MFHLCVCVSLVVGPPPVALTLSLMSFLPPAYNPTFLNFFQGFLLGIDAFCHSVFLFLFVIEEVKHIFLFQLLQQAPKCEM